MKKRTFALSLIAGSLLLIAAACGGSATVTETSTSVDDDNGADFVAQVDDTRLNPDPTPEGELGDTTLIGEFRSDADRGYGTPHDFAVGEELVVDAVIKVRLTFIGVVEDTRCAEGATCDDPGRAAINVGIVMGGLNLGETEFSLEGGVAGDPRKMGANLSIQLLELSPLPNADDSEVTDYVATVQLTR
jgi:hypothetical protein